MSPELYYFPEIDANPPFTLVQVYFGLTGSGLWDPLSGFLIVGQQVYCKIDFVNGLIGFYGFDVLGLSYDVAVVVAVPSRSPKKADYEAMAQYLKTTDPEEIIAAKMAELNALEQ